MTTRRPWADLDGVYEWRQYLATLNSDQAGVTIRHLRTGETRTFASIAQVRAFIAKHH